MINRATTITVDYCPELDERADYDQDCDGCKHFRGMNSDYEVLCDYGRGEGNDD